MIAIGSWNSCGIIGIARLAGGGRVAVSSRDGVEVLWAETAPIVVLNGVVRARGILEQTPSGGLGRRRRPVRPSAARAFRALFVVALHLLGVTSAPAPADVLQQSPRGVGDRMAVGCVGEFCVGKLCATGNGKKKHGFTDVPHGALK